MSLALVQGSIFLLPLPELVLLILKVAELLACLLDLDPEAPLSLGLLGRERHILPLEAACAGPGLRPTRVVPWSLAPYLASCVAAS